MGTVSTHSEINRVTKHTSIQIVQLEEVPFLVHLIRMTVHKSEDWQ